MLVSTVWYHWMEQLLLKLSSCKFPAYLMKAMSSSEYMLIKMYILYVMWNADVKNVYKNYQSVQFL